jgi:hypothetical protein
MIIIIVFISFLGTFLYYGTLNLFLNSLVIDMRWILLDEGIEISYFKLYFSFKVFKIFLENSESQLTPEKEKEYRNVYRKALRHKRIEYFVWMLNVLAIIWLVVDVLIVNLS